MAGWDVERQILEAIPVRAPDDRADDLQQRRDDDERCDLYANGRRLQAQRDTEENPRREPEDRLLERRRCAIERQRDRDEPRETGRVCDRAARAQRATRSLSI